MSSGIEQKAERAHELEWAGEGKIGSSTIRKGCSPDPDRDPDSRGGIAVSRDWSAGVAQQTTWTTFRSRG